MSSKQYMYSILKFRTSLGYEASDIPLAVIVVSTSERKIVVVGQEPILPDDATDLSLSIFSGLEEMIKRQITEALSSASSVQSLFDALASQNRWNLYITPVQTKRTTRPVVRAAMDLFFEHVTDESMIIGDTPPTAPSQAPTGDVKFWGESLPADELVLA